MRDKGIENSRPIRPVFLLATGGLGDKGIENQRPICPTGLNRPIYLSRQVKDIVP